ncbi:MAG TPA: glycosyltransferase family 1 protein [Bryobacteraceae bacterium]|nr:glycosyltransferase family 1 protein [Bryobacteraceae bacterium]
MRVLINALGATMGGALRHVTNLLPALAETPGDDTYDVLVRSSVAVASTSGRVRLIRWKDDRAGSALHRGFSDLIASGMHARKYDVLVSLMNFGPVFCPIPHILFQCNALYYSPRYRASLDRVARMELALRRRWAIEAMRHAHTVVTPSGAMAEMILEDCPGLARQKFRTLYHGFENATLCGAEGEPPNFEISGSPKLLYTAHLGRYKNFEVLLRALTILKKSYPAIQLLLTFDRADHPGDFDHYAKMAAELDVAGQVVFMGRVDQREIGALYRAADVFLFPSFCESFGFPLLEAIGSGLPIVASDIRVNREICRGAALYFDPDDPASCALHIQALLENPALGHLLRKQGTKRLQGFDWSWRRYANEFVAILQNATLRRAA